MAPARAFRANPRTPDPVAENTLSGFTAHRGITALFPRPAMLLALEAWNGLDAPAFGRYAGRGASDKSSCARNGHRRAAFNTGGRPEERISDEKVEDHQHRHGAGGGRFVRSLRAEQPERSAAQFERNRCQCSGNFAHRTGHRQTGQWPIGRGHADHWLVGRFFQKCRAHEEIEGWRRR